MADPTKKILVGAIVFTTLAGGALFLYLAGAAFYNPHTRPPRADCANNLRQIGLGLHMYSGDNNEKISGHTGSPSTISETTGTLHLPQA